MEEHLDALELLTYNKAIVFAICQLNRQLQFEGAIFRLAYNVRTDCIDIVPASTVWLHEPGCIINISKQFQEYIKQKFKELGYEVRFNNVASCFWLIRNIAEVERHEVNSVTNEPTHSITQQTGY